MESVEGLDRSAYGLVPVECAELGGLIFVRLEPAPGPSGRGAQPDITGMAAAAVAPGPSPGQGGLPARGTWSAAGWKIVWENNRECWHCHVGHPEYIKSHFDTSDTTSPVVRERIARRTEAMLSALDGLAAG